MPGRGGKRVRQPPSEQSEDYLEKRRRNNEAVHRTREKRRQEESETGDKVKAMREENEQLERRVEGLNKELSFLKEMFVSFAAAGGDQSGGASSSSADNSTASANDSLEEEDSQQRQLAGLTRNSSASTKPKGTRGAKR